MRNGFVDLILEVIEAIGFASRILAVEAVLVPERGGYAVSL